MKNDHLVREKINELRDIAVNFRDAQQLRERIAYAIADDLKELQRYRNAAAAPAPSEPNRAATGDWGIRK